MRDCRCAATTPRRRQDLSGERAIDHAGKLRGNGRLAGQRQAVSIGDDLHQRIPIDRMLQDAWTMSKFGQVFHQIVVDLRSWRRFAEDELAVPKVAPATSSFPARSCLHDITT